MVIAILLIIGVCIFEFVNGFHDTANAVATVIYTETLQPKTAVIYSAVMNFLGILVSTTIGYSVAYKIFHLFPWADIGSMKTAVILIVSMLLAALLWNIVTWRYKIPSSSTHALISSLIGSSVGLSYMNHLSLNPFNAELMHIVLALFLSPLIGALFGFLLYQLSKVVIHDKSVFHAPHHVHEAAWLSRLLIFTCGFVSFNHGSNDGQKGIGLILIVLVATGLLPFSQQVHVPLWAIILIPTVLSIGTMIGWERIVETVGKKIGTHEMTYAQGASAELVAATTIGVASLSGLPVSTTHVLSSAVMGTMITGKSSSINRLTIKHIALAWILTIPFCGLFAFGLVMLLSSVFGG